MTSSPNLPVAVLLDNLDDEYQVAVMRGALSASRDLGVSVLCVPGGRVRDPSADRAARNAAFALVNPETVSAVVAVTSVIGSALGASGIGSWLDRFQGLPLCCVGVPVQGHVAVEVDNTTGIRELVLHLVREHGRKRIAFLKGPAASSEADARYRAYQSALGEAGLPLDDALTVDGDFLKTSGAAGVRTLLDERQLRGSLDGIAAANDYMALGAMQELWRRHINVPNEISVVGFDDVESARFARPALTTTHQPTAQLGRRGFESAVALTRGGNATSSSAPTKLVIRSSCGCPSAEIGLAGSMAVVAGRTVDMSFVQRRQTILAEMARAAAGRLGASGAGWETRLLDALIADLRGSGGSTFYRAVELILQKLERAPVAGIILQDVLTALRRQSLPCVAGAPEARDHLEDAVHEARVLISVSSDDAAERRARVSRELQRGFEHALRSVLYAGSAELSAVAAERLPEFGVDACAAALFAKPGETEGEAELLFGFGQRDRVLEPSPVRVAALTNHPLFASTARTLVALPLTAFGQAIGILVVATAKVPDDELEHQREFLSAALDMRQRVLA